MELHPYS